MCETSCCCCKPKCLKPVKDCTDGQYYYYGVDQFRQVVKMQLVVTGTAAAFVVKGVVCQIPGPPIPIPTDAPEVKVK